MSQLRPQIIDGLWHCLCPSFEQLTLSSSLRRSRTIPFTGLTRPTNRQYVRARDRARGSPSPVTIIPSHPKNPTFWKPKHLHGAPPASLFLKYEPGSKEDIPTTKALFDSSSNDIRVLSDARIHTVLQNEVRCAYYDRVQEIVEILIRERGERPDKIHYHALISVQANLEHGSAAEVERLLQEMEEYRIELDAGICSAVLKVCECVQNGVSRSTTD